jgi:hypothetical protein
VRISSVTSNEPVNGLGDGDASPDWTIIDAHHINLRAERSGTGTGRTYTITITCTDGAATPARRPSSSQSRCRRVKPTQRAGTRNVCRLIANRTTPSSDDFAC